jgi:hypothetical protein
MIFKMEEIEEKRKLVKKRRGEINQTEEQEEQATKTRRLTRSAAWPAQSIEVLRLIRHTVFLSDSEAVEKKL